MTNISALQFAIHWKRRQRKIGISDHACTKCIYFSRRKLVIACLIAIKSATATWDETREFKMMEISNGISNIVIVSVVRVFYGVRGRRLTMIFLLHFNFLADVTIHLFIYSHIMVSQPMYFLSFIDARIQRTFLHLKKNQIHQKLRVHMHFAPIECWFNFSCQL